MAVARAMAWVGGLALAVVPLVAGAQTAEVTRGGDAALPGPTMMTEESASAMLEAEGFSVIETQRTLLGRIRIVALGPMGTREIVLHPGDGRVLRDIIVETGRPAAQVLSAAPVVEVQEAPPREAPPAPPVVEPAQVAGPEPVPEVPADEAGMTEEATPEEAGPSEETAAIAP